MSEICDKCIFNSDKGGERGNIYYFANNVCEYEQGLCNPDFYYKLNLLCDYYRINRHIYIKKCCYNSIEPIFQHLRIFKEIFVTSTLDFSNYVRIKLLGEYCFDISFRNISLNNFNIIYSGKEKKIETFDPKYQQLDILTVKYKNLENDNYEFSKHISFLKTKYEKIEIKNKKLEEELYKKDELNSQYKQELMEQADKLEIINNELSQKDDLIKVLENKNDKLKTKKKEYKNELHKKDKLNKRLVNILTIYKYHELNNVQKYNYKEIKEKNKKLNNEFKRVAKLMKLNK